MDQGLDPRTWKRSHLAIWAFVVLAGGAGGMIFGWFVSPFETLAQDTGTATMLSAWLHYPESYWPFIVGGALVAGLAYYAADLLTGAR